MAVTVEMRTQVSQLYYALFGRAPDAEGLGYWVQQLSGGKTVVSVADDMFAVDAARAYYPAFSTNEELVESFYLNTLGRVADAEGLAYWTAALNAPGATPGSVITDLIYAVVGYSGTDAAALTSQQLFNNKVTVGQYYGENNGDIAGAASALVPVSADAASVANAIAAIDASGVANGLTFTLTEDTAAGADVMRLTGDMDVRIDLTANNNQVKGLDLDGDGVIEPNGVENNNPTTLDNGKDFEIVDAYSRDLLNQGNLSQNFAGDIAFDGTGFAGDGVDTDGNIFLGGLGADTALGGIGNDFLTGGGVADASRPSDVNENGIIEVGEVANFSDELFGGRNADFFFAELSLLDSTDGNNLTLHGGQTSDDAAVGNNTLQDSDWLLLEVSDDEDGTTISLTNETDLLTQQFVSTGAGQGILMDEIENVDASGNLYGFLNDVDVAIGGAGKVVNGENVAIGASAQLNIIGSAANNILIGGYDNDRIDGSTGDDLLMGGNLNYAFNNVNAAGIANNGMDELFGGAGDDNIVFEADSGIVDGGANNDTLWLTRESLGIVSAANASTLIEDGVVRIELENGDSDGNDTFAGTGGADVDGTADQTNYLDSDMRVNLDNMENVIATGLGAVDYKAAGSNDPDLNFNNQQNHFAYNGDLDLRGTGVESVTFNTSSVTYLTVTVTSSVTSSTGVQQVVVGFDINDNPIFANVDVIAVANVPTDITVVYAGELSQNAAQARFVTENPLLASSITAYSNFDVDTVVDSITGVTSDGVNVLYAAGGADVLEGREGGTLTTNAAGVVTADGRDKLSGGAQADDFIFAVGNYGIADGVDVIHRQVDANADNLWDEDEDGNGLLGRDFALEGDQTTGASVLTVKIAKVGGNVAGDELDDVVNFVSEIVTGVKVGSAFTAVTLNTAEIKAAVTYQGLTDAINNALDATAFGADLQAALQADGITIFITDAQGRELADTTSEVAGAGVTVNQKANTQTENVFQYGEPEVTIIEDRLIYASYEDRSDNELVDDDSYTGSTISLGTDAYAEDLVVDFAADGTRIAEDQSYVLNFDNLTTEDTVEINVNGVKYSLRVGVDLDGNEIAGEELTTQGGNAGSQEAIQAAFLARMAEFINTFMDDDTAAGQVNAAATATTLTLTQVDYNGEETVFMSTPTVVLGNQSTGEKASVTVLNNSQHEVHLLDFDGRDGALNEENVLFIGNMGVDFSRATLETGEGAAGTTNTMNSSEAMIVDGGSNTLQSVVFGSTQAIADNTATNAALRTDFTVHGDDLLITGVANDIVNAGTGDDRVIGSLGADTLDGGKSYYAVKVLGEAQSRVYVMNEWEAQNPTKVTALTGLTISSINRIADSESGLAVVSAGVGSAEVYDDTLQFEQADFAANTKFTVTLNGFTGSTASTLEFRNAGAGTVAVDNAGNGTVDSTTTFTNFENIRTVSGTGNAVANDGQGDDTLNVSALSTASGGISYDLTSDAGTAGDVNYSKNASINGLAYAAGATAAAAAGSSAASVRAAILGEVTTDTFEAAVNAIEITASSTAAGFLASVAALTLLTRPTSEADGLTGATDDGVDNDYETQVIKVDGVENVIAGNGNDLLIIDESEAAKNNSFNAGTGNDRIEYQNDYATDAAEPVVTIKLDNIAAVTTATTGTDTVTMTGGRVGLTQAVDSLTAVERITLAENTAQGLAEADVLDVTAMTTGAVVDYTNGQVRDLTGTVHVTIENIYEIETVLADGNDLVIVADSDVMNNNARSDEGIDQTDPENILFMSYLDYDQLNDNATTRKSFAAQVLDDEAAQVINQGQFTFALSEVGTEADIDRVDYSNEDGRISVVVGQATDVTPQYVMVDGDQGGLYNDPESRVDILDSVEEIVAAQGESILDFTNIDEDRQITFQYNTSAANPADEAVIEQTIRIADGSGNALTGLNTFVEKYVYNGGGVGETALTNTDDATWNRVEGSDAAEVIIYNGSEDLVNQAGLDHRYSNDVLNLRGGNNEVRYSPLETSITLVVQVVEEDENTTDVAEGLITANVLFQDGLWDGIGLATTLPGSGFHTITSHTSDNSTASGNLKIEASQDAEDVVAFNTSSDKVFILGSSPGVVNVQIGDLNSMVLTGFEFLQDADTNDVYQMDDLDNVAGNLVLIDDVNDHDLIKVFDDALGYDSEDGDIADGDDVNDITVAANTIDLKALNDQFDFDFEALDVSEIDNDLEIVIGTGTDELVLGEVGDLETVTGFGGIVFTQKTVDGEGDTFVLNVDTDELDVDGAVLDVAGSSITTVSFRGLVAEDALDDGQVAAVEDGITFSVEGDTATAVSVFGGDGNDSITGGAGDDELRGGKGNDTLDGDFDAEAAEVQKFVLTGNWGTAGVEGVSTVSDSNVTFDGFAVVEGTVVRGTLVPAGANAAQIGSAIVREWAANPTSFTHSADISSITYDAGTQAIVVTYKTTGVDIANALLTVVEGAETDANTFTVAAPSVTEWDSRDESLDTYVFEATAALNGVDTINNFNATGVATDDVLNVAAFLSATDATIEAVDFATGLNLTGGENYGVVWNKGTLSSSDIVTGATANKIAVLNNGKAVVLVTADVDGVADATNQAYSVYYVEDTDVAAGQTWSVTKVGTVNSASELSAFALDGVATITGTAAADVLVGTDAVDTINGLALNDTITGGAGNDNLTGGTGADTFVVSGVTALTNGSDTIADFALVDDTIQFSLAAVNAATAGGLVAGAVAASNFVSGAAALDANDYFVYNAGALSFDADGSGVGGAVLLITLTGAPVLTVADIVLV